MRVLITGGFGFVGGRLGKYLQQSGHDVVLGSRKKHVVPEWLSSGQVACINLDNKIDLKLICSQVDVIVHAAGMNAQDCAANPVAALKCNAVGTAQLLEVAIEQGIKRFIYLSTAHVYSNSLTGVITEDTCPTNLQPYAVSHFTGENVVRLAHKNEEIEGCVIRLSHAYGAPAHKDVNCWMLLVNDLCRQVASSRQIVMKSNGLQKRNFITMSDVCSAIKHLMLLPTEILEDGLFNLGGEVMQVIEMAKFIQERCEKILDFSPNILLPKSISHNIDFDLDYCVEKLLSSGFSLKGDIKTEIDDTLRMCNLLWGKVG